MDDPPYMGRHKTDQIILYIKSSDILDAIAALKNKDSTIWHALIKRLSIAFSHELTHKWQSFRRGHRSSQHSPGDEIKYNHLYFLDPEEITTAAHDIINDIGLKRMKKLIDNGMFSFANFEVFPEFQWAKGWLNALPDSKRQKATKRLLKSIVGIVQQSTT